VRRLFVLLSLVVVAVSCGPTSTKKKCDAQSCSGCCSSTGECLSGGLNSACGKAGAACTVCSVGLCTFGACLTSESGGGAGGGSGGGTTGGGYGGGTTGGGYGGGTGGGSSACGPSTCTGCCTSGGSCVGGYDDYACGYGGTTCGDCISSGYSCGSSRVCVSGTGGGTGGGSAGCSASTCSGCCTSSGTCVGGYAASACGYSGQYCTDCASSGYVCSSGRYCDYATGGGAGGGGGSTCSSSTCSGCCTSSGACVSGTSGSACGYGGSSCADCASSGYICASGGYCDYATGGGAGGGSGGGGGSAYGPSGYTGSYLTWMPQELQYFSSAATATYTFAIKFTPNKAIIVRALRYIGADTLLIYDASGTNLLSATVSSPAPSSGPFTWKQYNLTTPLTLQANQNYYVGYSLSGEYYGTASSWPTFQFPDGTVDLSASYYTNSAVTFPTSTDTSLWAWVNLIYSR
jgi:hypothetical protein